MSAGKAFVWMDRYLDTTRLGPMFLKLPKVADLILETLGRGCEGLYLIGAQQDDERSKIQQQYVLLEASSWGKVDTTYEQMVYAEATLALPLIAGLCAAQAGGRGRARGRTGPRC